MSKRQWGTIDPTSPMDRKVTEYFRGIHDCPRIERGYLTNALIGQHTGLTYRLRTSAIEVMFECLGCRERIRAQIPNSIVDQFARLSDATFDLVHSAMSKIGCSHQSSWKLSPTLIDRDGTRYRIVDCRTCKHRARILW